MTRCPSRVSQWRFRAPASPLATHRLPRDGSPAFNRYYEGAKTSALLLAALIAFARQYPPLPRSFAHSGHGVASVALRQAQGLRRLGVVKPVSPLLWRFSKGERRISQVPREPFRPFAPLSDPGLLAHSPAAACPVRRRLGPLRPAFALALRCGPRENECEGSNDHTCFGTPSRGFWTRSIRFVTPSRTTT